MKLSQNSQLKMSHLALIELAVKSPYELWKLFPEKQKSSSRIIVPVSTHKDYNGTLPSVNSPVKVKAILIDYIKLKICTANGALTLFKICKDILNDLSHIMTEEELLQLPIKN